MERGGGEWSVDVGLTCKYLLADGGDMIRGLVDPLSTPHTWRSVLGASPHRGRSRVEGVLWDWGGGGSQGDSFSLCLQL